MVEKWIHRECERDVADLVQPTQNWSGGPCAVCKQTFGVVWLNEVEEAVSEPSVPSVEEVDKLAEPATAFDVLHETETALETIEKEAEIARLRAEIEALEK